MKTRRTYPVILTRHDVAIAFDVMCTTFGRAHMRAHAGSRAQYVDFARLHSFGSACQELRKRRGLSLKQLSDLLRVPQYRLQAIETADAGRITPEAVRKYLRFADLEQWATRWARANPDLAPSLGLSSDASTRPAKTAHQ